MAPMVGKLLVAISLPVFASSVLAPSPLSLESPVLPSSLPVRMSRRLS
ncbi:MAG: hypothetical protein NT002_14685 [candidate division Zixibacteria bacterium]|nr:hypothetical protein [candidate division Zixibacteria bacterium]